MTANVAARLPFARPVEIRTVKEFLRHYRANQPRDIASFLYFLRMRSAGVDIVKIGYTTKPWSRLSDVATRMPWPVELACFAYGTLDHEAMLHLAFADLRLRGEWFTWAGEVPVVAKKLAMWQPKSKEFRFALAVAERGVECST